MRAILIAFFLCLFIGLNAQNLPDPGLPYVVLGTAIGPDPEGGRTWWTITAGNKSQLFTLNNTTGRLTVKKKAWQTFIRQKTFYLTIKATDSTNLYNKAYWNITLKKWTEGNPMPWPYNWEIVAW